MSLIWLNYIQHDQFLLFVTDTAPFMIKVVNASEALYPKMIHLNCLAHTLHRVADTVTIRKTKIMVINTIFNIPKI